MLENDKIKKFWDEYLHNTRQNNIEYTDIFSFGSNPEMANRLSALVVEGKKKATTTLYKLFDYDNEKFPEKGSISIIVNGYDEPVAIIKDIEIKIVPFKDITEEDAKTEGEGDCSLKYWRDAHTEYFKEECEKNKINFSEDMLVIFEIFETIYSIKKK
jgi:uncharacterized protein YhfF